MSPDTLALEMSEFAKDSLKMIGFAFSNHIKPEVGEICHVRKVVSPKVCMCFHDQVHFCCPGLDFGISG